MSLTASERTAVVADDLRDRGFTLEDAGWTSLARGGSTAPASVDAPLALVSLTNSRPLTVVSAIANAAHEGYIPVLVAGRRTEEDIEPVLSAPFLLAGRSAGSRRFFTVEDRIRLSDDSYACVGTSGAIEWFESAETATDDPPLVLEVGGGTVATLASVDGLACPGPSVSEFRWSYARSEDGQFRIFENGEAVGRYPSISRMRADGFRPLPLPLVPEHHVRDHGRLARATVVATVADDEQAVTYRNSRLDQS